MGFELRCRAREQLVVDRVDPSQHDDPAARLPATACTA